MSEPVLENERSNLTPEGRRVVHRMRFFYVVFRLGLYSWIWLEILGSGSPWKQNSNITMAWASLLTVFALARLRSPTVWQQGVERASIFWLRLSFLVSSSLAFYGAAKDWDALFQATVWAWALGAVLVISGLSLLLAAQNKLGPAYFDLVHCEAHQRCVSSGGYRYLRHPGYVGEFMATVGSVLFLNIAAGVAVVCCLMGAAFIYRIWREEKHLMQHLEGYPAYATRVKKLGII